MTVYPQLTVVVGGRWFRFFFGITFRSKVLRHARFDGHRLWAVRVWPIRNDPGYWRLAGIQTRRAVVTDRRLRAWL